MSTTLVMPESIGDTSHEETIDSQTVVIEPEEPTSQQEVTRTESDSQEADVKIIAPWNAPSIEVAASLMDQMTETEDECRAIEFEIDDIKDRLKNAKKRLENKVSRLRDIVDYWKDLKEQERNDANRPLLKDECGEAELDDSNFGTPTKIVMLKDVGETAKEGEQYEAAMIDEDGDIAIHVDGDNIFLSSDEFEIIEWDSSHLVDDPEEPEIVQDDDSWESTLLSSLEIPAGSIKLMTEAGIETIGQLAEWTSKNQLADIKGIGSGKATKIEDALEKFWATSRS